MRSTPKIAFLAFLLLASAPALAQERVQVVELFTSRSCAFCPEADAYFHTLLERPDIIGLACHVSYFEVDKTSLSHPFCGERQSDYNRVLRLGPNYTPEMVINGQADAVGYKEKEVQAALAESSETAPFLVDIKSIRSGTFQIKLPALAEPAAHTLSVLLLNKPHHFPDPKLPGMAVIYQNVVSDQIALGAWDGTARTLDIEVDLRVENKGFVILAQNSETMRITVAGQYLMGAGP